MDVRTIEELTVPDRRTSSFGPRGLMLDRRMQPEAGARFIQETIAPFDLAPAVPDDVRAYFDVARQLYIYGLFVYEFFTLAADRALFACELALRERYKQRSTGLYLEKPGSRPPMLRVLLKWAKVEGLLSNARSDEWLTVLADLRNFGAHPSHNRITTPGNAARMIETVATLISDLWARPMKNIPDA